MWGVIPTGFGLSSKHTSVTRGAPSGGVGAAAERPPPRFRSCPSFLLAKTYTFYDIRTVTGELLAILHAAGRAESTAGAPTANRRRPHRPRVDRVCSRAVATPGEQPPGLHLCAGWEGNREATSRQPGHRARSRYTGAPAHRPLGGNHGPVERWRSREGPAWPDLLLDSPIGSHAGRRVICRWEGAVRRSAGWSPACPSAHRRNTPRGGA